MNVEMNVIFKDIDLLAETSLITLKSGFMNCGEMDYRYHFF